MAAFTKFNSFAEALAEKVHNLGSDVLKVMLSNTAPAATNTVKANITEITPGNGYVAGGYTLANVTSAQAAGTYKLDADDFTITAAGGAIGPFRYFVLYNDTATNDELIGFWDSGASTTTPDGGTFPVTFNAAGILTLT